MSLRRLSLDEVGICAAAGEQLSRLVDPTCTDLIATDAVEVDEHNLIAQADGATSIKDLSTVLSKRGLFSPLLLLPQDMRIAGAAVSFAPLFDKAVHHADVLLASGELLSTPRAPRSAVGPDALGLALHPARDAIIRRAGLALFHRRALMGRVVDGDVAAALQDIMRTTHAAMATCIDGVLTVFDGDGEAALPIPSLNSVTGAVALSPLARPSNVSASVLVGFPRWGRLLQFVTEPLNPGPRAMFAALENRAEAGQ